MMKNETSVAVVSRIGWRVKDLTSIVLRKLRLLGLAVATALLLVALLGWNGLDEWAAERMKHWGIGHRAPNLQSPIRVGETFPDLVAAGWLNGPPPTIAPDAADVLVVDFWSEW